MGEINIAKCRNQQNATKVDSEISCYTVYITLTPISYLYVLGILLQKSLISLMKDSRIKLDFPVLDLQKIWYLLYCVLNTNMLSFILDHKVFIAESYGFLTIPINYV